MSKTLKAYKAQTISKKQRQIKKQGNKKLQRTMKFNQKNREAVMIAGFRTPFMLSGQDFKNIREDELGASTIKELVERASIKKEEIEELIVGNSEGADSHLAQSIARTAGLSDSVSAWTVKNRDLSSWESLLLATIKIKQGLNDMIVAGGVDNISQKPFLFRSNKIQEICRTRGWKQKAHLLFSLRPSDIDWPSEVGTPFFNRSQEPDYDRVFADFSISRVEQEKFVSDSFRKAQKACKSGKGKEEIIPIFPPFDFDLKEKDGSLSPPLFTSVGPEGMEPEELTRSRRQALWADGAVFFLIMSREKAKALGHTPLVSLHSFAHQGGATTQKKALGPLYAVENVIKTARLRARNINLWEIGESCPAQTLACLKGFATLGQGDSPLEEVDPDQCNVNGGALALGDPPGATFARMVLSLMREMKRRQVEWGLATMGLYSNQAGALILKNEPS